MMENLGHVPRNAFAGSGPDRIFYIPKGYVRRILFVSTIPGTANGAVFVSFNKANELDDLTDFGVRPWNYHDVEVPVYSFLRGAEMTLSDSGAAGTNGFFVVVDYDPEEN